jgi:hypothetical protein
VDAPAEDRLRKHQRSVSCLSDQDRSARHQAADLAEGPGLFGRIEEVLDSYTDQDD